MKHLLLIVSLLQTLFGQYLSVRFIDVGQGDAILITCPTNEHRLLIDAGDMKYPLSSKKFRSALFNYLPTGSNIDVVIASHNHTDHIGNMEWVLKNYIVNKYIDNGLDPGTLVYKKIKNVVKQNVKKKQLIYSPAETTTSEFTDFCPDTSVDARILLLSNLKQSASDQNNASLIILLRYLDTKYLFTGDAESKLEKQILSDSSVLFSIEANVFKANHHGSRTSNSKEFLSMVNPDIIVISSGEKNVGTNKVYKHPQLSAINNMNDQLKEKSLRKENVDIYDDLHKRWITKKVKKGIYLTKIDHDIQINSDGNQIWVK